jgi:TonB family protein
VGQLGRRQAVLFSLIVHLMIVTALTNRTSTESPTRAQPKVSPTPRPRMVFIPPASPLRPVPPPPTLVPRTPQERLAPVPTPPPPPPRQAQPQPKELYLPRPSETPPPPPTTVPKRQSDRISIGTATGTERELIAPREGVAGPPKDGRPGTPASPGPPLPEALGPPDQEATDESTGAKRQRADRGVGEKPVAREERSIAGSIRRLEQRTVDLTPTGEGGAVRQMGPLLFDDQGADFTAWINHWRNEVYRNWIVPQAVLFGFRKGHVDFEFVVERDGSLSSLRMLKSSGVPALDRAAENALRGSRMLALPGDYRPPRITMQVMFLYNEKPPQGS